MDQADSDGQTGEVWGIFISVFEFFPAIYPSLSEPGRENAENIVIFEYAFKGYTCDTFS